MISEAENILWRALTGAFKEWDWKTQRDIIINDEILSNIAMRIDTNVRELEGVLNKLIASSGVFALTISTFLLHPRDKKTKIDKIPKIPDIFNIFFIKLPHNL